MLRFVADECLDGRILRGLLRRLPDLDIVRIQDTDISGADDPALRQWAAETGRVVLTQDVDTMPRWAYERINAGEQMPGVVEMVGMQVGAAIEELVLLATTGGPEECDGQVIYLPL
jgi:hypothetical protein